MERIVIDITSDPSKLQATIDQLEKIGKVDKTNADQFKRNNDQQLSAIEKLKASLRSLEQQRDNASSMEKMMKYQKMIDNQKAAIDKLTASERARQEQEKKSVGIIENLTKRINQLKEARDKANDPAKIIRYNKLIQEAETRHATLNGRLQQTATTGGMLNGMFNKLGGAIVAAFAVERIIAFGKEIVQTRAEFQKFEAQLTTALGSQSAAQQAMIRIQTFAAKTPFSVQELTESFVRLANRGIQPSNATLTKLGDTAAALGKPMSQVIEAILDINNTERWNELGVKVKTNGDKITGTFKGMTVTMDRTEKGAMKMIEAFGSMEGVAGGMERQMNTLGGSLSNLDDNWTNLMNTMGKSSEGVFNFIIDGLNNLLGGINSYISGLQQADETLTKLGQTQLKSKSFGFGSDMLYGLAGLGAGPLGFIGGAIMGEKFDPFNLKERQNYNVQIQQQQEDLNKILAGDFAFKDWEEKRLKKTIEGKDLYKLQMDELKNQLAVVQELEKQGSISKESATAQILLISEATKQLKENTKAQANHVKSVTNTNKSTKEYLDILPPLVKKLADLKMSYRELEASRLKDHEKLDAQRKIEEDKALQAYDEEIKREQKLLKDKKITQKMYQDASKLALDIFEQEKLNIKKKYGYLSDDLDRELALKQAEHQKRMSDYDIALLSLEYDTEEEIYELRLKSTEDYFNKLIELEQDYQKKLELIKQKEVEIEQIKDTEKKRKEKLLEDERNEARRHELAMMEIADKGEKEILKKKMEYSAQDLDRLREQFGEGSDIYQKELNNYLELEAQYNKLSQKNKKEWVKDWVNSFKEIVDALISAMNNMIQAEIDANNTRISNQQQILETQRVLAQKGLDNTLAFEQKRNDELAKQQLELQRKQKRMKELQIFLNAMAKFAEEDPKSALSKSLALIAAAKVAEAIFAEEGAIVGTHETKFRGQRHRSGRDRIAIVEEGEVILPKKKAAELGLNSASKFNQFLKTPFKERVTPVAVATVNNYDKLATELKELKEIIKNKQEVSINWDNFDTRIETRIKSGLKEVTQVKKHRI